MSSRRDPHTDEPRDTSAEDDTQPERPVAAGSTGAAESAQAAGTTSPEAAGAAAAMGSRDEEAKDAQKRE